MENRKPYTFAIHGSDYTLIREISRDIFNEFDRIHSKLNYYYRDFDLVSILEANFIQFQHSFSELPKEFNPQNFDREKKLNALFNVNRHAANVLMAFRLFLDHTETRLKRSYGENSEMFEHFDGTTSHFYDETDDYSIIYQLRNFVLHVGKPITATATAKLQDKSEQTYNSELSWYLDRDALLNKFDGWKEIEKKKLKEQPKEINPLKLFESAVKYIKCIDEQVRSKEKAILRDDAKKLMNLFDNEIDKAINFAVGLAKIDDDNGKMEATLTKFPFGPLLDLGFEFENVNKPAS